MVYVVMLEWLRVSLWSSHAHIETMMDNAPVSVSMPCVLTPHQAQHIPGDHLPNKLQQLSAATIFRGGVLLLLLLTCCVTWFLSITWSSSACGQCWCRGEWRLPGAASTQGMRTGAENQELSHTDTSNFRCGQHTSIPKLFESAIKIINFVRRRKRARIGPTLNAAPSDIDK